MTTDVAKVYGGALYDLAAEEGLEDELLTQQQTLAQVLAAEPQWLRLLAIPSIPKPERTALLDEALAGVHPYLVNFSKILCERESIGELPACFKEYRRRYNKAHGILTAVATAAVPMTEEQKARLTEKLRQLDPALSLHDLETRPDQSCLGGVRLDLEGVRLDGTLKSRLDTLRQTLAAPAD